MNKSVQETINLIKQILLPLYGDKETNQFIFLIFDHLLNYSKIDIHLNQKKLLDDKIFNDVLNITNELKKFKPIQYIFGKTYFYELPFAINENTLIPRPETEELVNWIISTCKNKRVKVLDIGTGSGCIAVVLSKYLQNSEVHGCDISEKALETAKENAIINQVKVNFFLFDILTKKEWPYSYDIIVSNPPYVCESEKALMNKNVLDFEPHTALFVEDSDPLIFYREIADFGNKYLNNDGCLFFEINERFGNAIQIMLGSSGYQNIEIRKDINGKDRMIKADLKKRK